jgi:dihydroorotate dehydrogenase electron transfer subunit
VSDYLLQRLAPVVANERLNEKYCRVTVSCGPIASRSRPGQFVTVRVAAGGPTLLRRPFSIHRVVADGLQLLVKLVGPATEELAKIRPGRMLDVLGPLGDGVFAVAPERPRVLLVAGGVGVAPLLFLADKMQGGRHWPPTLIFGGATALDLPTREQFAELGVPVRAATMDGSLGRRGPVTDELTAALDERDPRQCQALACGPTPMLRAVAEICAARGVPCRVSLESLMACGVGSCRGCVVPVRQDPTGHGIPYTRVCHEGPVCAAEDLAWEQME